jgi:hypothetical protein
MDGQLDPLECFTPDEVECRLKESIQELFAKDAVLLQHDVSERAITHKLAEYLQVRFPSLNVDCEYNRNAEMGEYAPKNLQVLRRDAAQTRHELLEQVGDAEVIEEELLAISSYPDIIVHRRVVNSHNLMVIEVKKCEAFPPRERDYPRRYRHDYSKLRAFTDAGTDNPYHYRYGFFLLLGVRSASCTFDLQLLRGGRLQHQPGRVTAGEQHGD